MGAWVHSLISGARSVADGLGLLATISIASVSGLDEYGNSTYGAARSVKCVLKKLREREEGKVLTGVGDPNPHAVLTIPATDAVTLTDKITLPDGTTPKILKIEGMTDASGTVYALKVTL